MHASHRVIHSPYSHTQLHTITQMTDAQSADSDDEGQGRSMVIDDPEQRRKRVKT